MARGQKQQDSSYDIVLVGGGSAGITTAARLVKQLRKAKRSARILIIDPAQVHYYQPIWTLVGAGVYPKEVSMKKLRDLIPRGVELLQEAVTEFKPDLNQALTKQGTTVSCRCLVVCPGLQVDWARIPGLVESVGKNGVCSNYSYETVESTWTNIREFKGGNGDLHEPTPAHQMWWRSTKDHVSG
jgi:sulfide:quinone oxidoreductase